MLKPHRSRVYYGWVIVAVALLMNVAASPTNAVAFSLYVVPMSEDLGWSRGALALALTSRLIVAGISSPFLGILVDRFGARILGALAGLSAGLCIIAVAFVHELWMFYGLFAISGLSGFGGPAGQLLTTVPVAKWFVAKRGRALAIATVGMPLGTAFFLPIEQVMIDGIGWRGAWAISGVLVILLAVPACLLFMRKDPESIGLRPDGAPEPPPPVVTHAEVHVVDTENWTVHQMLRSSSAWFILASTALSGLAIQGTLVYRFSFWEDVGIPSSTVALGTSIDPLTVVFSGLFFGILAERVSIRYLGLIGGIGVALSMLPLVFATNAVILLFAHNFLWGAAMGANLTVNNIIWPNYFGRKFLGAIRGIVFPLAVGTAAISAPVYALLLSELAEPRYVWLGTAVTFLAAGLLVFFAKRPHLERHEVEVAPAAGAAAGALD